MKNYISALVCILSMYLFTTGCDEKPVNANCNQFSQGDPFIARIDEQWCLNGTDWIIRFGPVIEDSRCNVPGIECIWAGRYVMAATIDNGDAVQDTFYAVDNWRDTLYSGPYLVILNKVFPETRPTTDELPPSEYSFEMIVK